MSHAHVVNEKYCIHGTGAPWAMSLDYSSLGRGSGPRYRFLTHDGNAEDCPLPKSLDGEVPPCSRECVHTHQIVDMVCIICGVTTDILAKEQAEKDARELRRREAMAESMREFEAETLEELRAVFDLHGEQRPSDSVLAGLVDIVDAADRDAVDVSLALALDRANAAESDRDRLRETAKEVLESLPPTYVPADNISTRYARALRALAAALAAPKEVSR